MTSRTSVALVCAGLAGVLLTACTASTKSSSAASGGLAGAREPAVANGSGEGGGSGGNAAADVKAGAAGATVADAALAGPSLIRTAQLTVAVRDVAAAADRAGAIAEAAGGSVDADHRTSGPSATATVTLRVPPAVDDRVLSSLAQLGHEDSRQLSTQDVSTDVADVASRVGSAEQTIAALRVLYARAQKVSDVIAIETQLAQREADLESLQARQRALSEQVAMATITLTLRTLPAAAAKHAGRTGFVAGAAAGWHAFAHSVRALATAFGAVLPFAVVLLVIAAAVLVRRRRRQPANAEPAPGS